MSLKLFFLRHGQTSFSRANAFCGSGLDPEITPDGAQMAQQFAAFYAQTEWKTVFCSSLQRAILTATPLCNQLGIEPEIRPNLREISYGKWEGQSIETVSRDYHDDYLKWSADPAWNAPTGGENGIAIAGRVAETVEEIKGRFESGNVLIVSHKATIRIALCSLLGIDVGRFRVRLGCPVGSVSVVEFGRHGPLLQALADRTHLDERLRNLPGT